MLLKQVFGIDIEHCSNCGGELKIIAAILEQPVIEKILTQLGLQGRAPGHGATSIWNPLRQRIIDECLVAVGRRPLPVCWGQASPTA